MTQNLRQPSAALRVRHPDPCGTIKVHAPTDPGHAVVDAEGSDWRELHAVTVVEPVYVLIPSRGD